VAHRGHRAVEHPRHSGQRRPLTACAARTTSERHLGLFPRRRGHGCHLEPGTDRAGGRGPGGRGSRQRRPRFAGPDGQHPPHAAGRPATLNVSAEDPYLSGTMAAAYINGLQKNGVSACIKHFVANDQEFERFTISSEVAERPLHEIYLEPFRLALEKANPWSIMSAYNRINGTYASENDLLLHDILKEQWGYDGAVISDWYGTYSDNVPGGRLDLEMPGARPAG
jgi:hypothetical protein